MIPVCVERSLSEERERVIVAAGEQEEGVE